MNIEKFIRILGYIVYVTLWAPMLVIITPIATIAFVAIYTRLGFTFKETCTLYAKSMKNSILHDMEFIRTGIWY